MYTESPHSSSGCKASPDFTWFKHFSTLSFLLSFFKPRPHAAFSNPALFAKASMYVSRPMAGSTDLGGGPHESVQCSSLTCS